MTAEMVKEEEGKAMLRRARHLPERDRAVLELFYGEGMSRKGIGRMLSEPTGTVSRRLARVTKRLKDPVVVALVEAPEGTLSAVHRSIGLGHFLCGVSLTKLAREHGMSVGRVGQVIEYLKGWVRGRREG